MNKQIKILLQYNIIFHSILMYGILAWGDFYNNILVNLQNMQNCRSSLIPLNLSTTLVLFECLMYDYNKLK